MKYSLDIVKIRGLKRKNYQNNIEANQTLKRIKYASNKDKIREKKRKYYILHRRQECDRVKKNYTSNPKYKEICNKKYYENHKEYIRIRQKKNLANKIFWKYKQMYIKANKIGFLQSIEIYIRILSKKIEITEIAEKRIQAEQIIKWCIHARDNYIIILRRTLSLLKEKAIASLTRAAKCPININFNNYNEILCGLCKHTSSTESYFYETSYKYIKFNEPLIINENGQIINILPITENSNKQKKKMWQCGFLCKGNDVSILDRLKEFLTMVTNCSALRNIPKFIKSIETCTLKHSYKLGHSQACYIDHKLCKSKILALYFLSPHYPRIRNIQRLTYRLKLYYEKLIKLDKALHLGDIQTLKQVMEITHNKCTFVNINDKEELTLNEDEIISKYSTAFTLFTKRYMDIPQFPCLSCEKLCFEKNVIDITKFRKPLSGKEWKRLINYLKINTANTSYICRYCLMYFRRDTLPPTCILNNLYVDNVPDTIVTLNEYEKILIQRAKAFQTIQKMGTVSKKNLPHCHLQKKVKGRTFHLPLPIEETIKKICAPTDVINPNHELYILIRGVPTKSKIIWENLVDVKKVYDILTWLKKHNCLYSEIQLPSSHENLLTKELNDTEYQLSNKVKHDALLTQITDSDSYYEQFTIYPMYDKRINESSTALYQMLKVQDVPINNRHQNLDLLCFPDLYPFGKNGQHEDRPVHLPDNEFIKSRLLSKHSRFRLNIQYIFYLLNDTNIRQLNSGIYHKMNIVNPREKFTAKKFLETMSKNELEGNISTIFSRLRNTAHWRKPRCDLSCMIHHYGPATWFLTLSPSEWLWSHMIEYLREINPEMSKKSANELIACDPISVSRYMENKFHAILDFICSSDCPIGEVTHYFWRREYQGRGTQHFHLLIWIKNAPIIGESSNEEIVQFLLKYVTCKLPDKNISPLLYRRVNTHQRHIHNSYCLRMKKSKKGIIRVCRFGFSRPVTKTLILKDIVSSIGGRKGLRAKSRLYDLPRKENEKNINDYNPVILTAWEGNMDIQFIGEKSTLLNWYCTKYTTKYESSSGNDIFEEINSTKSLRSRLWNFAMRSLNNRECGALEACDTLLGISLYGSDSHTTIRWLDVNEIRGRKVKPQKEIESLNKDSTDIFCKSIIDNYYPARPQELESLNLYNFAKWYDITKKKPANNNFYVLQDGGKYPCYIKKRQREYLINHYKYNVEMQPEKYFYSLLLLFKPWRNISELKEEHTTYTEAFINMQSQLPEAVHYHEKISNDQKCLKDMKEAIEKHINEMSQEKNKQSNDETEFIPLEAGNAMYEFRNVLDKTEQLDINELISGLNNDQKRVFNTVVDTITSGSKCLRHYVSGEGGTGKSYLIKTIKCWIQETIKKDVAIVAPTGIAAFNIDGLTLHRLFQLPVEHGYTPKYRQLSDAVLKTLRNELKNTSLIIIDEISMVSNITFMYVHLRLSEIFNTFDDDDGWFAKKHILLFGDLLQLPPVHEESIFINISKVKAEKYLESLGVVNLWNNLFTYDELKVNMRQKNDNNYKELLSRLRLGIVTDADIKTLNSRKINFTSTSCNGKLDELCDYITKLPCDTICLLPKCHLCNILNTAMLKRIPSENISLLAQDIIDCPTYLKKKILKAIDTDDEDSTKTAGLSKEIIVKIGAKIMLRRNIDVTLGLVNGTIATITKVSRDITNKDVDTLTITLANGKEYNIERVSVKFEIMDKAYVIRKQFPLSLSYGITIHKSQGLSLNTAIIDVGNLIFSSGQTYVALSRLTSIEGLHLINFDPACVKVNELAIVEYNRLRTLYRQDIENINIKKNCCYKIKDQIWAMPITIDQDIYTDSKFKDDTLLSIKGFKNIDKVSCYANTTIQCLIHCSVIRKLLLEYNDETNIINRFINDYISNKNLLSTTSIKQFVGNPFILDTKQDAAEFLIALCAKITLFKDVVGHDLSTSIHCTKCNYTNTKTQTNFIIVLTIPTFLKQSVDLEYILRYNFSRWSSLDGICDNCKENGTLLVKYNITSAKQIIVLQLALFSYSDEKTCKMAKCNIKGAPTVTLSIATNLYKVSSAIFHHGNTLHEGYFTNMLRDHKTKKSKWIYVNDEIISYKPWPRNSKDAYIFFLEQCK